MESFSTILNNFSIKTLGKFYQKSKLSKESLIKGKIETCFLSMKVGK
jgi:hypothetical protein